MPIRVIKPYNIQEYNGFLDNNELPYNQIIALSLRYRMIVHILWEIYNLKIDKISFQSKFGVSLGKALGFELFLAKLLGYIVDDGERYLITEKGLIQMCKYL